MAAISTASDGFISRKIGLWTQKPRCARPWRAKATIPQFTRTWAMFTPSSAGPTWPRRSGKNRWRNGTGHCRQTWNPTRLRKSKRSFRNPSISWRRSPLPPTPSRNSRMTEVRIPAFAKINLRLDILGKRPDGYHELRTIFQTLSLHDELRLGTSRRHGIALSIQGNASLAAEPVQKNLVYRAVDALKRKLKIGGGVEIELRKEIPAGGGLGGGSSDAVAAMLGYLQLTGEKLPAGQMMEIAASLGADVPFFLLGGRALGVNRGNEIYPLEDIPKLPVLVVVPREVRITTPDAFRWVHAKPLGLTNSSVNSKLLQFCALSWSSPAKAGAQGNGLSNDFEGPVFRRHPRLEQIKRALLQKGATEASLAGSGSAVFGIFPSPAMARRAAVGFPHDQTFVCETLSRERYARRMHIAR